MCSNRSSIQALEDDADSDGVLALEDDADSDGVLALEDDDSGEAGFPIITLGLEKSVVDRIQAYAVLVSTSSFLHPKHSLYPNQPHAFHG